eukprot:3928765-Rhodomonas_salina.3
MPQPTPGVAYQALTVVGVGQKNVVSYTQYATPSILDTRRIIHRAWYSMLRAGHTTTQRMIRVGYHRGRSLPRTLAVHVSAYSRGHAITHRLIRLGQYHHGRSLPRT